ncbi:MAG: hypothetical protein K6G64_06800 [Eubacterium sp.]|nr:hypothetical protein [Eubacterium sp.]
MSYVKAEEILPKEVIEIIQQYASGVNIYIPCKEKKEWGSQTDSRGYYRTRNDNICEMHCQGKSVRELASEYALSEKSIRRILRETRRSA